MNVHPVDYTTARSLTPLMLDYISGSPRLNLFFKYPFAFESFEEIISDKKFPAENRKVLSETLKRQYAGIPPSEKVRGNIEKMALENTFTVTTAHQPFLFTGRLYFIYKIINVINITERLNKTFPDKNFVPVYYMGSEDHDFEEINHIYLFGEKIEWKKESAGAVGRLTTEGLEPLIKTIEEKLSKLQHGSELVQLLKAAYLDSKPLAEATLYFTHQLFKDYGLVVLNADDKELKKLFVPVMEAEIIEQVGFRLANETINELQSLVYKVQASPREINFFYLTDTKRERLVFNELVKRYEVLNTPLSFNKEELVQEIYAHPERFSPNVFYRPLYQETILPNLAYIGGGGELAYWLEEKKIFEHFEVNFPMLVLRNSVLLLDGSSEKKIEKAGITIENIFMDEEELVKHFVKENTEHSISLALDKEALDIVFEEVMKRATTVDPSLEKAVEGQKVTAIKGLENLEAKMLKAEKRNFETSANQLRNLKQRLFPEGNLQERYDNFLPWYAERGIFFLRELKSHLDPFDKRFLVLKQF